MGSQIARFVLGPCDSFTFMYLTAEELTDWPMTSQICIYKWILTHDENIVHRYLLSSCLALNLDWSGLENKCISCQVWIRHAFHFRGANNEY